MPIHEYQVSWSIRYMRVHLVLPETRTATFVFAFFINHPLHVFVFFFFRFFRK